MPNKLNVEIAKFEDGFYFVVDGVKANKVEDNEEPPRVPPNMKLNEDNIIQNNYYGLGGTKPIKIKHNSKEKPPRVPSN